MCTKVEALYKKTEGVRFFNNGNEGYALVERMGELKIEIIAKYIKISYDQRQSLSCLESQKSITKGNKY